MRNNEKEFLKQVGDELTPLFKVQNKLGISEKEAKELAEYLEKHNLIRLVKFNYLGEQHYVVCKPLIKIAK